MTRLEAIKYGVNRYKTRTPGEEVPSILYEKDGNYQAVTWSDENYATECGWKYAGNIPDEARVLGLI